MNRCALLCLSAILLAILPACPRVYQFTNADVYGNRTGVFTPTAIDGATEGDSASEPREIVEPDVFRRDGNILYVLNQYRGLALIDLDQNTILCRMPTYGMPRDLYLVEGRAYVLVSNATRYTADGNTIACSVSSCLYVVNVEDPEDAQIVGQYEFEGDLIDSRVVGDILYAVCAQRPWWWGGGWEWGVAEDGTTAVNDTETIEESWVTSINIADPQNIYTAGEVSFEALGNIIHCTDYAIFVAGQDQYADSPATAITYVDISDPAGAMAVRGTISVRGYVNDRYKLDAYGGILRVVAALGWGNSGVAVTTINLADPDHLVILGSTELEGAVNETLYATRFDGPRGYIVTYETVDPLFVLDFSNPAAPVVLGELIVPGWSTHIEPRGDRLVALGVDDTDGRRRVCVSLFDVTLPEASEESAEPWSPTLVDRVTFGENWAWSSAYGDVKAFNVMDDLLLVPFSGGWGEGGYNRLQFVSWTPDNLEARGWCEQRGNIIRSFEYDGAYYCITDREITQMNASDLDNPAIVGGVILAENVFDYFEIGDNAVEIIGEWQDPVTTVRLYGLEKAPGELVLKLGELVAVFPYGTDAVLVGATYGEKYTVALVDCAPEGAPALIRQFDVEVVPYWNLYYDRPVILEEPAVGRKMVQIWPWWPQLGEPAYLAGGALVLLCGGGPFDIAYGVVPGGYHYMQGLAVVDLAESEYTTVGLAYPSIVSLDQAGDSIYVGTCVEVAHVGQPLCAYYLREFHVPTLEMGPAANVPGRFVDYDPANEILCVRNDQWAYFDEVETALSSLHWDGGGAVTPVDSIDLPRYASEIVRRGNNFFGTTWDDGAVLFTGTVSPGGELSTGASALVTRDWASILGARPGLVYFTVNNAVVRYRLEDENLALEGIYPAMGYPTGLSFGADSDYVCLGYSGVLTLPK